MSAETVPVDDVLSRQQQRESPLYQGRVEVYAKSVKGQFRKIKWIALIVLLAIYYITPWIRFDRGANAPNQAVMVDMEFGRLYFFWIEIWPQEVYFLTGILILASFGLFLATALFGRVWCGFACPQTVWTDLYMMVERWIEGDRNQRIRFDKAPWTRDKIIRRGSKHAVWLAIAFWTGGAWIMYFSDAPTLVREFWTGQSSLAVYFFIFLFTATTYVLAGMAREQVCTYMCPWPRIQGALVDQDTMAVTYEAWRGEPRGSHKKGQSWDNRGHCVNCKQCVAVCPTGIDIRDGFQLECIGCGLCVDACNGVMAKVGLPPNLIAYDSERNQDLRAENKSPRYPIIRTRTVLYAAITVLVAAAMLITLALRKDTDVNVIPERNPLFVKLSDGSIRNAYTIKILNKENTERVYALTVESPLDASLNTIGDDQPKTAIDLSAPPDGVGTHRIFLRLPPDQVTSDSMDLDLSLTDTETGSVRTFETIFRGPDP